MPRAPRSSALRTRLARAEGARRGGPLRSRSLAESDGAGRRRRARSATARSWPRRCEHARQPHRQHRRSSRRPEPMLLRGLYHRLRRAPRRARRRRGRRSESRWSAIGSLARPRGTAGPRSSLAAIHRLGGNDELEAWLRRDEAWVDYQEGNASGPSPTPSARCPGQQGVRPRQPAPGQDPRHARHGVRDAATLRRGDRRESAARSRSCRRRTARSTRTSLRC